VGVFEREARSSIDSRQAFPRNSVTILFILNIDPLVTKYTQ
jgi:hypothetical protein